MQLIKQHIISNLIALILVIAISLPFAVKLAHVFENHKHEVCNDHTTTHFHEIDIDCDFYKFKINPNVYILNSNFDLSDTTFFFKSKIYNYNFLTNHQQSSTYLRGPPHS